jgi:hypothetical protein
METCQACNHEHPPASPKNPEQGCGTTGCKCDRLVSHGAGGARPVPTAKGGK